MRRLAPILCCALALPLPATAGNGIWTQLDFSNEGGLLVTNVERGRQVYGLVVGSDDQSWVTLSLLRTWQFGNPDAPWKLRAGTALKAEEIGWWEAEEQDYAYCDAEMQDCYGARAGVRLQVDRWKSYESLGLYLMADYSSIDNARLGVAGLTHLPTGFGGQISVYDDDDGATVPAVMVSMKLLDTGFSLRAGHKFVEEETFLGLSFSTY
ncbi:hypothetical protein KTN05_03220 [Paracoccus sp. Z118]|uniref:hypothetical protein n=1 Tax=Paracoccus sp. Z118 TaxID=2851017 RepID=UPI001C2C7092|nr:hypothetical protein [Paracoccus sp. Z118]MBV0890857.1 hypothetical protein [Paracoccus sp. Z118]